MFVLSAKVGNLTGFALFLLTADIAAFNCAASASGKFEALTVLIVFFGLVTSSVLSLSSVKVFAFSTEILFLVAVERLLIAEPTLFVPGNGTLPVILLMINPVLC